MRNGYICNACCGNWQSVGEESTPAFEIRSMAIDIGDVPESQAASNPWASTRAYPIDPGTNVPLRVIVNGNRLDIQASVDLKGLKKLQAMLEKYQGILEMMEPDKTPDFLE